MERTRTVSVAHARVEPAVIGDKDENRMVSARGSHCTFWSAHLLPCGHLREAEECLHQFPFAARDHAREALEPRSDGHLRFTVLLPRQDRELIRPDFPLPHPIHEMERQRPRYVVAADFRHRRRRRSLRRFASRWPWPPQDLVPQPSAPQPRPVPLVTTSAPPFPPPAGRSNPAARESLPGAVARWQLRSQRQCSWRDDACGNSVSGSSS